MTAAAINGIQSLTQCCEPIIQRAHKKLLLKTETIVCNNILVSRNKIGYESIQHTHPATGFGGYIHPAYSLIPKNVLRKKYNLTRKYKTLFSQTFYQ